MNQQAWHVQNVEEVFAHLKTTAAGLTSDEADKRRLTSGANELPQKTPTTLLRVIFKQFLNTLIALLLGAAAISFALGDTLDGYVILAAVGINVIMGLVQEYRAEQVLARLKRMVKAMVLVLRDGEERLLPAEELVPGDSILLRSGDRVPADCRLFHAVNLEINEAPLTGESFPVPKFTKPLAHSVALADRQNMAFVGTTVTGGTGNAVVTATGRNTEMGGIATLFRQTRDEPTSLQLRLTALARGIGGIVVVITLSLFLIGLLVGKSVTEIFSVSVAVAVAAIPEGMLVAFTAILAIGAQRMFRQHALIRRLIAAETLGSVSVICTDKTGTLTEGNMAVVRLITNDDETRAEHLAATDASRLLLRIGLLANDAHVENEQAPLSEIVITGNPTERALILAGRAHGLSREFLRKEYPRLDAVPFDSEKKYMATLHDGPDGCVVYVKGAPEPVLQKCSSVFSRGHEHKLSDERKRELSAVAEGLSKEGYRVLVFAYRYVPKGEQHHPSAKDALRDLVFVGLAALQDPLRSSAKETVALCKQAGITTVMLTGDHPLTAMTIASELGLPAKKENVLTGEELSTLQPFELEKRIEAISVYARVTPKDKLRIIDAWQARGKVVAMTGDGVNDAPALKSADVGIALGSGVDVAKEAADIVLLDNRFQTIVSAIRQGRVIYENFKKTVLYLLSDSFSEVLLIAAALVASIFSPTFPLPLVAAQILWINLVTDGFPSIALTVDPEEREIMRDAPRPKKSPLVTVPMRWLIVIVSVVSAATAFGFFLAFWKSTNDLPYARTVAFTILGIDSLPYVFSVRSLRHSILRVSPFTNRPLVLAVLGGFAIQLVAIYAPPLQKVLGTVPLDAIAWVAVVAAVLCIITVIEVAKSVFRRTTRI